MKYIYIILLIINIFSIHIRNNPKGVGPPSGIFTTNKSVPMEVNMKTCNEAFLSPVSFVFEVGTGKLDPDH
jgi:hypothetical protein